MRCLTGLYSLITVLSIHTALGASCSYSLSPTSAAQPSLASSGSLSVTAGATCAWAATTTNSWIHTVSAGTGNGTINYDLDANTAYTPRTGAIVAGGKSAVITQAGTPIPLGMAVGNTNLVWETGSPYPWVGTNAPEPTFNSPYSAMSGNRGVASSVSWLQTTVVGPGTISFWWKVDSDLTPPPPDTPYWYDYLEFDLNGAMADQIMGQVSWCYRSFEIPAGTNILRWQYVKDDLYNSGYDRGWLDQVLYTTNSSISLAQALDTCDLHWTSGGNANPTFWAGEAQTSHDSNSAARSGAVAPGQESWLQTTVSGVTNVSFWWKVSSVTNYDYLEFYTNSGLAQRISGEVDWQSNWFRLTLGTNVLQWRFVKTNVTVAAQGATCGWLDQVSLSPRPATVVSYYVTNLSLSVGETGCTAVLPDLTTAPNLVLGEGCATPAMVQTPPAGTLVSPGITTVLLTLVDLLNGSTTLTNTTIVADLAPPVVSLLGPTSLTNECHTPFVDPGALATDNCSGLLTVVSSGSVQSELPGTYTLQYVATDLAGNAATNFRTVYVVDTQPPAISLNGPNPMTVECHTLFIDPGALANDLCAGSVAVSVQGTVNANSPGTYLLTYTASDGVNSISSNRTVQVVDTQAPAITYQFTNLTLSAFSSNCQALLPDLTTPVYFQAVDTCSSITVTQTPPAGTSLSLGSHEVLLAAFDTAGNTSLGTNWVLVTDSTPPEIVQPVTPQTVACAADCLGTIPDLTADLLVTDACSSAPVIQQFPLAGTRVPLGVTNINFIIDDGQGNTNFSSTLFTVQDQNAPVLVQSPSSQSVFVGNSVLLSAAATACTDLSYQWLFEGSPLEGQTRSSFSLAAAQVANSGQYRVVVTGAGGSVTSAVAVLTVLELQAPVVYSPPVLNNGIFQFTFGGPEGQSYRVLASSDLSIPIDSWSVLTNGVFGAGSVTFSDPETMTLPRRFFRLVSP